MSTSFPSSDHRHRFFGIALLTALLFTALGSTSFQRKLASFQPTGLQAVVEQGGFRVQEAGANGALQAGDHILMVQGERPLSFDELLQSLAARAESQVLVERSGELVNVAYARPGLEIDYAYLFLALIGGFYLLMGLYTAFRDQRTPARLFFLWCMASAVLYILSPRLVPVDNIDLAVFIVDQAARVLLPCLTLHLFLIFPAPLLPNRLLRSALPVIYLPAALSLAFHSDQIFYAGTLTGSVTERTLLLVDRLELFFFLFFTLLAVIALATRLTHRSSEEAREGTLKEHRRQVQWIFFGMVGGYVPFILLYVVPLALHQSWPAWTEILGVVPLALVPLAFAWAILKYKLWDLSLVLRDSIAYTLTILLGLFGFSLIHLAIRQGIAQELAVARNLLTFVAGAAIAGVLVPTKGAITEGLERLQHRAGLGPRRALSRLGQELLLVRRLDSLRDLLQERLEEALQLRVKISLHGDPDFDLRQTEEFFLRDVVAISAIALPGEKPTVSQTFFADGYRYAFPLKVRDAKIGLVLLGYRYGEEPLNSEEVDLVRGVVDQAALAIENARLLQEVGEQLEEVRRLERRNEGILEASPAGIALLHVDEPTGRRTVVSANRSFADLVRCDGKEISGRPIDQLLPIRPLPQPEDGFIEVSYCEPSGRECFFLLSMAKHPQAAGNDLHVLVIQDVSERRALESALREKERLASLGMLAAGVAHEVNTPLTGISSYAQLLLDDTDPEEPNYEILKKVERQTFRAAQIVNNLLEFSRNRHDELQPVDLGSIFDECTRLLSERIEDAGVEIIWQRPEESLAVLGHEGELHQVFTNLVVNALDAMQNTEQRRLTLSLTQKGERLLASVSDTGSGIPPERIERVFQPFFSSKLGQGGTGLGLAITYNIVRRHRGEIRATNHSDAPGCTFSVELPLHHA